MEQSLPFQPNRLSLLSSGEGDHRVELPTAADPQEVLFSEHVLLLLQDEAPPCNCKLPRAPRCMWLLGSDTSRR